MATVRYLGMTASVLGVLEHAALGAGKEAEVCGLLGGYLQDSDMAVATAVYPLSNLSLREDSFAVDVEAFCRERDAIAQKGLSPLALYHSHLDGSTRPSFRDRRLPWITDLPSLILARDGEKLRFECYRDVDGRMVPIVVIRH